MLQRIATAAATATAGFTPEQQEQLKEGETIYREPVLRPVTARTGAASRSPGRTAGSMMAPPLAGSPRVQGHRDYVIKTLLHGMTGPLAGQTYTQVMMPMGAQNDEWIADVASYVRNEFGNTAAFVTPADVARVRAATASRKTMWTYPELEATLPRLLPVDPTWKATASHNAERARERADAARRGRPATPQAPDMWFQVELPQPAMVTEVQFDAGAPGGGGRGRGGRGRSCRPPVGARRPARRSRARVRT